MPLALVTGASSGIGAATARALVASGYTVVAVARRLDRLQALADELGHSLLPIACDASDGDAVLAMAKGVQAEHGTPDVLIHCAGMGEWKFIEDTTPAEAQRMMGAPYFAAFFVTHAFMPGMLERRSGHVLFVGSPVCLFPWAGATSYAAVRYALRGLNDALHMDLRGTGVRCSHVIFGKTRSEYFDANPDSEEHLPTISRLIRELDPPECAEVLLRVIRRPRRQVTHPFMLTAFTWLDWAAPWLVRELGARTGRLHG